MAREIERGQASKSDREKRYQEVREDLAPLIVGKTTYNGIMRLTLCTEIKKKMKI